MTKADSAGVLPDRRSPLPGPELDRLFRALADATRRDIVARVMDGKEASVTALAARYEMSFAAASAPPWGNSSRIIRGTVDEVWRAHHDPALVQRWLLGPEGWTMPVCELAKVEPPVRSVTTERMIGMEGPGTVNEMTLIPVEGGTLLSIVITYPDAATRASVVGTGMTGGMEASYLRLEREVLSA